MAGGWLIGVVVQAPEEKAFLRHYYAVGHEDRAKAEWTGVDHALKAGIVASSPVDGLEPVQAISRVPATLMKTLGLADGQVRALGWQYPRRWIIPHLTV